MKKIILLAALALGSFVNAQQITVNTPGGGSLEEGEVYTTSSVANPNLNEDNKLRFNITNNTEEDIYVKVKVTSIDGNEEGGSVQLCYWVCFYDIAVGTVVPDFTAGTEIAPGATTTSSEDHFISFYTGNGTDDVTYGLAFIKTDVNGTELETLVNFTYKYQPTAGVKDLAGLKNMGLSINNTVVKNALNIDATVNAAAQVYDINGRVVFTGNVVNGSNALNLSGLSTGVYTARFKTADNKTAEIKLVKN